jgi:2-amino-4-hydroxy-6-hydroxymethyldihydropteridine diphosphokinase
LGSNIDPEKNIFSALDLLGQANRKSRIWKTESFGANGPDFLNMAVEIETILDMPELKESVITCIEKTLARIRTENKNAPRTIDIDIMLFNGEVMDYDIWGKAFAAIPVSELMPDLINPNSGDTLSHFAEKMKSSARAELFQSD